ncbi:hypothetical protein Tco_0963800 [Tanacetum coccineum]
MKIRQFLALAGYYQRFIEGFSKVEKPLNQTYSKKYEIRMETERRESLSTVNVKTYSAPILPLPNGTENFVVYYNASHNGLARHGSRHHHPYQQVLDVFKDEGRLSEAIRFTGTTRNTPLGIGKYSYGFYHKPAKDNKLLLYDLGNRDHQKSYANVRRKPLEFQVGDVFVERSDMFWQTGKAEPTLY